MRLRALVLGVIVLAGAFACGGAPPQIVDYSPLRGAHDVSTAASIQITFDHDVDEASVASRLHLVPETQGVITWISPRKLVYEHRVLATSTVYQVVIDAGYHDPAGNVYALRHQWSFTTEPPPSLAGASPADGAAGVDPADYLTVEFTHPMNAASLKSAITFTPAVQFSVRLDPSDGRRAIVAPDALLQPATAYHMLVTTAALDADGNQLDLVRSIQFTTGAVRPLHNWIAFGTESGAGASGGLWIVNESGFPRQLLDVNTLHAFSWSPEGDRLVFDPVAVGIDDRMTQPRANPRRPGVFACHRFFILYRSLTLAELDAFRPLQHRPRGLEVRGVNHPAAMGRDAASRAELCLDGRDQVPRILDLFVAGREHLVHRGDGGGMQQHRPGVAELPGPQRAGADSLDVFYVLAGARAANGKRHARGPRLQQHLGQQVESFQPFGSYLVTERASHVAGSAHTAHMSNARGRGADFVGAIDALGGLQQGPEQDRAGVDAVFAFEEIEQMGRLLDLVGTGDFRQHDGVQMRAGHRFEVEAAQPRFDAVDAHDDRLARRA